MPWRVGATLRRNTGGSMPCIPQHLSLLGLLRVPAVHEALGKSRSRLWEMKRGWERRKETAGKEK